MVEMTTQSIPALACHGLFEPFELEAGRIETSRIRRFPSCPQVRESRWLAPGVSALDAVGLTTVPSTLAGQVGATLAQKMVDLLCELRRDRHVAVDVRTDPALLSVAPFDP